MRFKIKNNKLFYNQHKVIGIHSLVKRENKAMIYGDGILTCRLQGIRTTDPRIEKFSVEYKFKEKISLSVSKEEIEFIENFINTIKKVKKKVDKSI